jgi:hypothetical protein
MNCPDDSRSIYKLAAAIIALDARLSSIEAAAPAGFDCPPTDPGLSHSIGCDTTFRYPCDPISSPLTPTGEKALEELWTCLKFIKANLNEYTDFNAIHKLAWSEVQRRAKALFPGRTL